MVVRANATVSTTAGVNRGSHRVIADGLGRTCDCIHASSATQDRSTRTRRKTGDECRKGDVAADPSDPLVILAAGLPSAKTMGDLGRPATTWTSHSARTATCGSMNFNVSLVQ